MILLGLGAVGLLLTIIGAVCLCVINNKLLKIAKELVEDNIKLNKENLLLNIEKAKLTEKATMLEAGINMIEKEIEKKLKKEKSNLKTSDLKPQIMELYNKGLSNQEIGDILGFKKDTVRKAIAKWKKAV